MEHTGAFVTITSIKWGPLISGALSGCLSHFLVKSASAHICAHTNIFKQYSFQPFYQFFQILFKYCILSSMNFLNKMPRMWATFDEYSCLTHIKWVTWPTEKDNETEQECVQECQCVLQTPKCCTFGPITAFKPFWFLNFHINDITHNLFYQISSWSTTGWFV